jgi:hypothetical protein
MFVMPPKGTIEDRWQIYRSGYFIRIQSVLMEEYRALTRILGEEASAALFARYLRACPPRTHDLGDAGDRLADFLVGDALTEQLSFLPDLARLERAVADCFIAEDCEVLQRTTLCSRTPAALAEMALCLLPGTRLLRSAWPLLDLWRCRAQDIADIDIRIEDRPEITLVYRHRWRVRVQPLHADTALLVETLLATATTLEALQSQVAWSGAEGASRLLAAFGELIELGVVSAAETAHRPARIARVTASPCSPCVETKRFCCTASSDGPALHSLKEMTL